MVTTTTITPAATSPSPFTITNEEIVSEVDKLRGDKRGKARLRSNMGVLTFGLQLGPWHKCKICESLVHKSDIKNSTKGELCVDCYAAWMELAEAKRNAELNKSDESNRVTDKNVSTLFPQVVKDMFGIWAGNENWVHDMAMDELAKVTGFSVEALNYILFRMPKPDIIKIDGLEAWIEDVMDIYDVELDVAWDYYDQNYNWEEPVEILLSGSATKSAEKPASEVIEQKALPAPKYVVRLQTVPSRGCRFCRRKIKCSVKRQVTSEFAGYCNRHFHVCGTEGCKETANHTRHDGIRVCHFHARGIKSAYSDTTLRNEGFLVGKEI